MPMTHGCMDLCHLRGPGDTAVKSAQINELSCCRLERGNRGSKITPQLQAHVFVYVYFDPMSIAGCKYQLLLLSEQLFESNTSYNITHAFGEIVKDSYLPLHIPSSCWVIKVALAIKGNPNFMVR